jgi:hypothetical protein
MAASEGWNTSSTQRRIANSAKNSEHRNWSTALNTITSIWVKHVSPKPVWHCVLHLLMQFQMKKRQPPWIVSSTILSDFYGVAF